MYGGGRDLGSPGRCATRVRCVRRPIAPLWPTGPPGISAGTATARRTARASTAPPPRGPEARKRFDPAAPARRVPGQDPAAITGAGTVPPQRFGALQPGCHRVDRSRPHQPAVTRLAPSDPAGNGRAAARPPPISAGSSSARRFASPIARHRLPWARAPEALGTALQRPGLAEALCRMRRGLMFPARGFGRTGPKGGRPSGAHRHRRRAGAARAVTPRGRRCDPTGPRASLRAGAISIRERAWGPDAARIRARPSPTRSARGWPA